MGDRARRASHVTHYRVKTGDGIDEQSESHTIKLSPFFGPCYSGFNDDDNVRPYRSVQWAHPSTMFSLLGLQKSKPKNKKQGFYTVYRTLFEKISVEEEQAEADQVRPKTPSFGTSKSNYSSVQRFYSFWSDFSTRKSFACNDSSISVTSSNRSVPVSASSKRPVRGASALVNAPRS